MYSVGLLELPQQLQNIRVKINNLTFKRNSPLERPQTTNKERQAAYGILLKRKKHEKEKTAKEVHRPLPVNEKCAPVTGGGPSIPHQNLPDINTSTRSRLVSCKMS